MKSIPGYEGLYSFSDDGEKIWSHKGKGKFLKFSKKRYYQVVLQHNTKKTTFLVHRLKAQVFIPNPNNYPVVRHLDNIRYNNDLSNLQWCTHKDNTCQAFLDGLIPVTEKRRDSARRANLVRWGKIILS